MLKCRKLTPFSFVWTNCTLYLVKCLSIVFHNLAFFLSFIITITRKSTSAKEIFPTCHYPKVSCLLVPVYYYFFATSIVASLIASNLRQDLPCFMPCTSKNPLFTKFCNLKVVFIRLFRVLQP